MKMFVFEYISKVSDRYHPEGGLVIVAKDKEQVIELIEEYGIIEITEEEWKDVIIYELKNNEKPRIFAFPDAGCC